MTYVPQVVALIQIGRMPNSTSIFMISIVEALERAREDAKPKLDLDKPIFAVNKYDGCIMVLLPQLEPGETYKFIGYNWFKIDNMDYNSCAFWKTKQEAIDSYSDYYDIINGELAYGVSLA